ncbi:hypothetical protein [Hyphomonas pacifica]|uniref:Uncharacterized protein n=1 Tax=Hyphomonas pacifica TaxID=1280941 RepID=A0A062TQR1_9PROT|nr:hypothetical protein [Hyphomonas pacifica]KCZ49454.1 hypothetical protein HY2_03445 [Hyphomonas pacifica]RAN33260.1 hypothetical protein HY3_02605 [Hyphomonas pacifica]
MTDHLDPQAGRSPALSLSPKQLAWALVGIGLFLLMAHAAVLFLKYRLGYDYVMGLAPMFSLDEEANVPTLVSALVLLSCSVALALTACSAAGTRMARGWWVLSAAFLFLAFDENAQIHETLSVITGIVVQTSWMPAFPWILLYGLAVVALGIVLLPWFLKLDRGTQIRFAIAGTIYVGGALGMEVMESALYQMTDPTLSAEGWERLNSSLGFTLMTSLQECLEYGGAAYFLYVLVKRLGAIRLQAA